MKPFLWISALIYASLAAGPAWAQALAPPGLDLEAVLKEVVENNPELKAARSEADAADARIPQAFALDDPQAGVMQWSIPSNFDLSDANETWYSVSQNLPFFGKRALRGSVADLEGAMARENFHGVERRIISQTKQAYYDLFFAHKALAIHHEQLELAKKFSEITREKFSVGEIGQQDVIRAQMEVLDLSNALITLEQERETAAARLNALLNRPAHSPLETPETPSVPLLALQLETLQKEAEAERPENRMQALAIRRGAESVKLAERDLLPDFMTEISYWDVHGGPNRWMATVKINLPWLNKKKYEAKIRENEAEKARAEAAYQAAINETRFQVKDLFVKFHTHRRLVKLYEEGILPLAEQLLEAATIGYQAKKNDFLTLVEAQQQLRKIELAYFKFLADVNKTLAELEAAVGKTF